jgi:hypothetical protein
MESSDSNTEIKHESGAKLHQRETRWQINFPFSLGILLLIIIFLGVALPGDPVWRVRVHAIADWIYSVLCLLPLILCLLPLYLILLTGIYGLTRLHTGTETPLHKLETLSANVAERIRVAMDYINEKMIAFSSATAPLDDLLSTFDTSPSDEEELSPDE